jgi:hypothetical protein
MSKPTSGADVALNRRWQTDFAVKVSRLVPQLERGAQAAQANSEPNRRTRSSQRPLLLASPTQKWKGALAEIVHSCFEIGPPRTVCCWSSADYLKAPPHAFVRTEFITCV